MADTPLKLLIDRLRPLMKGTRSLGKFLADLVDCGLVENPKFTNRTALELRAVTTWKGYANGSDPLGEDIASELAGRWDIYTFSDNVIDAYSEDAVIALVPTLSLIDPAVNKANVGERLGLVLHTIFKNAAGHEDVRLPDALNIAIAAADASGAPYIDSKTNKLRIVDQSVNLPPKPTVPDEIQENELVYIRALVHAYCEAASTLGHEPEVEDIPKRFAQHFQDQRKAFYSAEWVKETSWDCIENGSALFDQFLETMLQGVIDTNLSSYPSERERLLATLSQAVKVQLDRMKLAQIIDLIDVWSRKGSCHELVSQDKLGWSA